MTAREEKALKEKTQGKVYLVGAGPGDPELLTIKAMRLLRTADAVLHDALVAPEILQLISPTAQIHNVGKRCGTKRIRQEEINFLMIALADSGLQVVRLKSGDPLIFGRAGEEMEALHAANIPYEVVPGVTSALGAAASFAIPLTHRRASSALVFITAHQAEESDTANWTRLAGSGATLVIYMPGHNYADIAARMKSAGVPDDTPCAIISQATTPHQQIHRTKIAQLMVAELSPMPHLAAPTLLIVGKVVRFADPVALAQPFITSTAISLSDASAADAVHNEEPIA
jgi:uroporphyrin-III C-methyltransferase